MKVGLEAKKDETLTNKEMLLRKQIIDILLFNRWKLL